MPDLLHVGNAVHQLALFLLGEEVGWRVDSCFGWVCVKSAESPRVVSVSTCTLGLFASAFLSYTYGAAAFLRVQILETVK